VAWSEFPRTRLDDAGNASSAQWPGTLSSPLRISHAVPTVTMRLPALEYVASLAWFRRIRSSPLDQRAPRL
jgi:hypothetical protein